uniref:Uncharacterized protein n=1 Tax=Physcomitrium patens TaxID=3218 RepID=A0A7I4AYX4_PHYPA
MKQDSSGAEQGGSSNSEQRPQPGQYDGRPMGPPPYGYSQQGPPPHFQHQHFRGPPPCAQVLNPSAVLTSHHTSRRCRYETHMLRLHEASEIPDLDAAVQVGLINSMLNAFHVTTSLDCWALEVH